MSGMDNLWKHLRGKPASRLGIVWETWEMIRLIGARCKYSNVLSRGVLIVRFLLGNLEIILLFLLREISERRRSTAFSFQISCKSDICYFDILYRSWMFCVGGSTQGSRLTGAVHLSLSDYRVLKVLRLGPIPISPVIIPKHRSMPRNKIENIIFECLVLVIWYGGHTCSHSEHRS